MNAPEIAPAAWRTKSANQTRLAFGQALLEIGAREPRSVVVSADTQDLLGIRAYIERFRDRFVELGIAEQNVIGAASGLATTGLHPYVCAYAPFITARSMEQVRNDIAYANQRVVIGAAASGISLGVAGGTHHALEDIALMRSLPNMTVIVPADVSEAYKAALATLDIDGPVYLRLGDWDAKTSSRCFVHIANSRTWHAITGTRPPSMAPSAAEYRPPQQCASCRSSPDPARP